MALPAITVAQAGQAAETEGGGAEARPSQRASSDRGSADTGAPLPNDSAGPAQAGEGVSAAREPSTTASTIEAARVEAPDLRTPNTQAHYFSDVDYSNDYRLSWEEVIEFYEPEIREGGWTRAEFIDEFDTDGDEFLDEDEYSEFLGEAGLEEPENRSSFMDID